MPNLGKHVRELRIAAGFSQLKLATIAGITSSAISQIESGKTKSLKGESLVRIAIALGVEPKQLLAQSAIPMALSSDERRLLTDFRALQSGQKEIALRLLKALKL